MNVPTTLPFFNGTRKQATRRDGSPALIFSPRTQLPPFQIQRPNVANDWVKDIFLVDCDGNETDIGNYFRESVELLTGGYTNGVGASQAYDTLTIDTNGKDINSAIKTTTGAGDAAFDSATDISIVEDQRYYLEVILTLITTGAVAAPVAPSVRLVDAGDFTVSRSNTVLLVAGENNIILTATATDATASLIFFNGTADETDFHATVTLTKTARPKVTEFTDVDYIEYYGDPLIRDNSTARLLSTLNKYDSNPTFKKAASGWDSGFMNSPWIALNLDGTPYKDSSGNYYMYYSSTNSEVTGHPSQPQFNDDRVGLALSTDLINWTRVTGLSSDGDGCVMTWGNGDRGDGIGHNSGTPAANEGFADGNFDENDIQIGTIIYDTSDSTFKCWYTGNDNFTSDNLKLGYATSPDGIIWAKDAGNNPILSYGVGDDDDGVYAPNVMKDGATWKMWYIGKRLADGKFGIMYATSVDEVTWVRHSNNWVFQIDVITNGMFAPNVLKLSDGTFIMLYSGIDGSNNGIRYATSPDGISWTDQGINLGLGAGGDWDDDFLMWPSVFLADNTIYLYYRADDVANDVPKIGFASYYAGDLLPRGTFYIKLTDGTNKWYSEWFNIQDVYENEILVWVNASYSTFISSGAKIISAINLAGTDAANTGTFDVANDEVITVILFLTLNSGAAPLIRLIDSSLTSLRSANVTLGEGINEIELTVTAADTVRLQIVNSAPSNFSTSDIWVRRQYSPRFVKLQFTNDKDLHGKRGDDQTILYQEGFTQECWLQTILNTPGANRVDVGQEKDGVFIPEKITTQYKYRIIDYLNRSLFEGLIRLPQHKTITIIDEVGNEYTPDVGNVLVSAEWGTFDTGDVLIEWNDGSFVWVDNAEDIT